MSTPVIDSPASDSTVNTPLTTDEPTTPGRMTAAQRRAQPSALDIATAAAEQYGVCVRPRAVQRVDLTTGEHQYIPAPCGNTLESVCPSCAKRARALRMQQAREGWHLDHEPVTEPTAPTVSQKELMAARADLVTSYHNALADGDDQAADQIRDEIRDLDEDLRATGMRGKLPRVEFPEKRKTVRRSTKRRQDVPDLPRRKVAKTTVGKTFDTPRGRFQPSVFVTLTLDSYGAINRDGARNRKGAKISDGTPVDPASYDYRRAARDVVHFAALFDRWIQNLRRVVGYDVQYFATVEPQKRGAPHIHLAIRGAITREIIEQVTAATYHQVWWPRFDEPVYPDPNQQPVWDEQASTFVDPITQAPLTDWDTALDELDDTEPAHVARFGTQVHSKWIDVNSRRAQPVIGYLTKYLTKSVGEVLDAVNERQHKHHERLHKELCATPCSPRCPVWLVYGIVPKGATGKSEPGRCKARAHRRSTLGLPGRRVLVSRKWTGKTMPDHRADRLEFVRQNLAAIGIDKPETDADRYMWLPVEPGDIDLPPREQLLFAAIAQRRVWRTEYDRALAAAGPPDRPNNSANQCAA